MMKGRDSKIVVVGGGAMGSGIAQIAAQAGYPVTIIEVADAAIERSRAIVAKGIEQLVKRGKINPDEANAVQALICWNSSLEAAVNADLVIEAIIEDEGAKKELFARLETVVGPTTILASNTSSLSIEGLASGLQYPDRFIGLHFFNPVPAMKLVEVIPGPATDPALSPVLIALVKDWGKRGVLVRDVPGFIVNRVARPVYAEGFVAFAEEIAPVTIDHVLKECGGFRMGPLELADLIGHDVNYTVAESVFAAYDGKTRFRPQPAQRELVEKGQFGRKTGAGFYDYASPLPEPDFVEPGDAPSCIAVSDQASWIHSLTDLASKAGLKVTVDSSLPSGTIRIDDFVAACGDGRPLSALPDIDVLIDHARDFATSSTLAITAKSKSAAASMAGLAHLIGKCVILVPDRPGQLILRTLAQLANAAADAVLDEVATPSDIDTAMVFGANHPEGPITWADRFGHAEMVVTLSNIASASGDVMYQPSPFFGAE